MLSLRYCLIAIALCSSTSSLMAQNTVDVYFIAGQSNAAILGELNSYDVEGYFSANASIGVLSNAAMYDNQTEAGFDLTFARIRDRDRNSNTDDAVTDVVERFTESRLDATNYAVDSLAVQLNSEFGNDIGIFSYGRNSRPLTNLTNDSGESWFPGTVAAPFNGELYGSFQTWSADRIEEVKNGPDGVAGTADDQEVVVQGILWFQGEADSDSATGRADYADNFSNLIERFREDFNNPDLAVVASQIRGLGANDDTINAALNAVALADANVEVIDISDDSIYTPLTVGNQHLDAVGFRPLANDFAQRLIQIQSAIVVPEPSSSQIIIADFNDDNPVVADRDFSPVVDTAINGITVSAWDVGESFGTLIINDDSGANTATNASNVGRTLPVARIAGAGPNGTDVNGGTVNADGFVSFTVTVDANHVLDLDNLVLNCNGGTGGNSVRSLFLTTDLENDDLDLFLGQGAGLANRNFANIDLSADLGAAQYQGLTNTSVTFSFWTEQQASSTDIDDLVLNGTVTPIASQIIGDVNCDGAVNFLDISPFITALSSGSFEVKADINGDGSVNFLDISPFIALLSGQ